MHRKLCALALSLLMFHGAFARPAAAAQGDRRAARVKAEVARLGTGDRARVKIELHDGRKLEGHVTETAEQHLTLTDAAGTPTRLDYTQIKKLKGRNLSTGTKVGIGLGLGAGLTLLVAYLAWAAAER
jgi:YD repeat-containing protein